MTLAADPASALADAAVCHLETRGRVTGRRRVVELWFGMDGCTVYFLAGGGRSAAWVRNLEAEPRVRVRIRGRTFAGAARVLTGGAEEERARRLLAGKYQGWREGQPLSTWARTALPVAVDLEPAA